MKNIAYCIRVKEDTLKELKKLSEQKKRPTSQFIRLILEDYIEKVNL